ncbi:MAG: hypothetical protein JOY80_08925 [Candidatus Dormibacteraeota bacterium]|nr:hypothetical protein [Candidatus Dormibacteraeota bacterium]
MSFQTAIDEMGEAKRRALERRSLRRRRLHQLAQLERIVEDVEVRNLQRDRQVPPEMWRELQELESALPVPAPPALWRARNTARLHDALLDWEAELLDEVAPHRVAYDDRHEE